MKNDIEAKARARILRFLMLSALGYVSLVPGVRGEALPAPPTSPASVLPSNLSQLAPAVRRLVLHKAGVLEAAPDDAAAWGDLGLVFEANLLWLQARSSFERAAELAPSDKLWRFHLAIATREAGDFASALDLLRALALESRGLVSVQQQLGLALLESGDSDGAMVAFSRVIAMLPTAPEGYIGAGDALLNQGRPEEAIDLLSRALELDPRNRGTHHRLGLALRAAGRLDNSRRHLALGVGATDRMLPDPLAERLERYAVHPTARIARAAGLLATGRPKDAAEILEFCLADHPENLTVLNNLAIARLHLGELEPARELLDRALAINARKFSTWINLTSWALRAGRPAQALEYADAAVERGRQSAHTHVNRAQVLARLGRLSEAATDFERAITLDVRNPRTRLAAAALNEQLGRPEAARDVYREAIELNPNLLPAQLGLGRLELALGRSREARAALEAARAIAPGHPQVTALERALAEHVEGL